MITHIHACLCGEETKCEADDLKLGRVFECPACKQVWAHVKPRQGGSAWISVKQREVDFHDLLGRQYVAED